MIFPVKKCWNAYTSYSVKNRRGYTHNANSTQKYVESDDDVCKKQKKKRTLLTYGLENDYHVGHPPGIGRYGGGSGSRSVFVTTLTAAATSNAWGGAHVRDTCGGFGATDRGTGGRTDGLIRSAWKFPTDRVPETSIRGDTRPVLPLTREVWMFVFPFRNYKRKKKGLKKNPPKNWRNFRRTERVRGKYRKRRVERRRPFRQKQSLCPREISSRKLKAATKPFFPASGRPRGVVSDTCTRRLNRNTSMAEGEGRTEGKLRLYPKNEVRRVLNVFLVSQTDSDARQQIFSIYFYFPAIYTAILFVVFHTVHR